MTKENKWKMAFRTIILDFDGTVADTRQSITETVIKTLQTLGVNAPDKSAIQDVIGLPLRDTFVKAAGITDECLIAQAVKIYRELYSDICQKTIKLFPDVSETLERLYNNGVIIAIASSKGRNALVELLGFLNISHYITCVLGEQDVKNKKPAPDMIIQILTQTNTDVNNALVVGDTCYDILMGQNAGCCTCGVSYGNHSVEQLQTQGANYIIDNFSQLLEIMQIEAK